MQSKGLSRVSFSASSKASFLWHSDFFMVQLSDPITVPSFLSALPSVPPTIEQGPEGAGTLVHRLGDLVSMACPVRGSPPIHVSWLKDGLPLPLSHRTHLHSSGRTLR